MTIEELKAEKKRIEKFIKDEEEKERKLKENAVIDKINSLQDYRGLILSLLDHTCSSCSDDGFSINGLSEYSGKFDCAKCMLREILYGEHGGRFDFSFDVDIFEV